MNMLIQKLSQWAENIAKNPVALDTPYQFNPRIVIDDLSGLEKLLPQNKVFFIGEIQRIKNTLFMQKSVATPYGMQASCYINPVMFGEILEILRYLKSDLKRPKIFISHATSDKKYISSFVDMLEKIGVNQTHLFCSSVSGYHIPLDESIYEYLRNEFVDYNLFVILMLSSNYYKSKACLNEMGAAWVLKTNYQCILLPGFKFEEIDGAIDPRKICFGLDDQDEREYRLTELKDQIVEFLSLDTIQPVLWERYRKDFLASIDSAI